ncbi:MAG TPA: NRDE family protein [Mycobacteriales bacterium]|nr:NRDE family protein [Mycobacteriales bacterium]
MCTVVVRWSPGDPVRVLALRDELVGRDFDDPDAWWPAQSDAVGGRDRTAGGTWCVTDVRTGATGLVLNRPEQPDAVPGASSRGALPLLAVRYGEDWPRAIEVHGMASFALVLATTEALTCWEFDGTALKHEELAPGTRMVTSGGPELQKARTHLPALTQAAFPEGWAARLRQTAPSPDPAALVVRGEHEGRVFATVFGQLFTAQPGRLELSWARQPWGDGTWTTRTWAAQS